jgi:hypothetical protein
MTVNYDKKLVKNLKSQALTTLNKFGIEARFTVRIKNTNDPDWVAQYSALSQFMNGGRGPIFWLIPELLDEPKEFVISLLHEYGHVIAEWTWINKNDYLRQLLSLHYPGSFGSRPWDEEEFAEHFAQYLIGNTKKKSKGLLQIIRCYVAQYQEPSIFKLVDFASVCGKSRYGRTTSSLAILQRL